jgi:hypothetical protein
VIADRLVRETQRNKEPIRTGYQQHQRAPVSFLLTDKLFLPAGEYPLGFIGEKYGMLARDEIEG